MIGSFLQVNGDALLVVSIKRVNDAGRRLQQLLLLSCSTRSVAVAVESLNQRRMPAVRLAGPVAGASDCAVGHRVQHPAVLLQVRRVIGEVDSCSSASPD